MSESLLSRLLRDQRERRLGEGLLDQDRVGGSSRSCDGLHRRSPSSTTICGASPHPGRVAPPCRSAGPSQRRLVLVLLRWDRPGALGLGGRDQDSVSEDGGRTVRVGMETGSTLTGDDELIIGSLLRGHGRVRPGLRHDAAGVAERGSGHDPCDAEESLVEDRTVSERLCRRSFTPTANQNQNQLQLPDLWPKTSRQTAPASESQASVGAVRRRRGTLSRVCLRSGESRELMFSLAPPPPCAVGHVTTRLIISSCCSTDLIDTLHSTDRPSSMEEVLIILVAALNHKFCRFNLRRFKTFKGYLN